LKGETKKAIALLSELILKAEETSCQYLPTFLINRGIVEMRAGLKKAAEEDCLVARNKAVENNDTEAEKEAHECLKEIPKMDF